MLSLLTKRITHSRDLCFLLPYFPENNTTTREIGFLILRQKVSAHRFIFYISWQCAFIASNVGATKGGAKGHLCHAELFIKSHQSGRYHFTSLGNTQRCSIRTPENYNFTNRSSRNAALHPSPEAHQQLIKRPWGKNIVKYISRLRSMPSKEKTWEWTTSMT